MLYYKSRKKDFLLFVILLIEKIIMYYSEIITNILIQKSILNKEEEVIINEAEKIILRIKKVCLQMEKEGSSNSILDILIIRTDLTLLKKRDIEHTLKTRNLQDNLIAIKYLLVVYKEEFIRNLAKAKSEEDILAMLALTKRKRTYMLS